LNNIEAKNYIDESTTSEFKFLFRCDCCKKIITEYSSENQNQYTTKIFSGKQAKNEKLWKEGHDLALFAAKRKALEHLNRCEICGKLICDDCIVESDKLNGGLCCKECYDKKGGK